MTQATPVREREREREGEGERIGKGWPVHWLPRSRCGKDGNPDIQRPCKQAPKFSSRQLITTT